MGVFFKEIENRKLNFDLFLILFYYCEVVGKCLVVYEDFWWNEEGDYYVKCVMFVGGENGLYFIEIV